MFIQRVKNLPILRFDNIEGLVDELKRVELWYKRFGLYVV